MGFGTRICRHGTLEEKLRPAQVPVETAEQHSLSLGWAPQKPPVSALHHLGLFLTAPCLCHLLRPPSSSVPVWVLALQTRGQPVRVWTMRAMAEGPAPQWLFLTEVPDAHTVQSVALTQAFGLNLRVPDL